MARIVPFPEQVPKQLELPLKWWVDPAKWHGHYSAGVVERPTEDEALENVLMVARHQSGKLKPRLGRIERDVYMLELRSLRECPRYFNEAERRQWVANKSGYGIQQVKDILASIDVSLFHKELIAEAEKSHRELVREVLAEMFPYFKRDAA